MTFCGTTWFASAGDNGAYGVSLQLTRSAASWAAQRLVTYFWPQPWKRIGATRQQESGGGGLATNSEKRELQRRQWGKQLEQQSRFRREQAESTRQLRDHTTVGPGPGYGGIPDIAREPYETRIDLIGGRSPFDRS